MTRDTELSSETPYLKKKRKDSTRLPMTISHVEDKLELKKKDRKNKSGSMRRYKHTSDDGDVDDGVKRFYGDGLIVKMHSNHHVLEITGDGCRIALSKNSGSVHIVGDGCRVRVNHNVGNIEYIGDDGRVLLGSDSYKGKVKFVGDGGKVILDSSPDADSKKSLKEQRNDETAYVERTSCKKVIKEMPGYEKCKDNGKTWTREDLDNIVNDMKERSLRKYGRNEEMRKSSWHSTVTIITNIQSYNQCRRKRFDDSSLIINSRSDVRPAMKSVSRTSDANVEIK